MIGKTIQEKRKELGLTQAQVAEQLGVTAPAVNRWEKGLSYPDSTLLAPLARLLKTDLNELFSFYHSLSDKERDLIVQKASNLLLHNDDDAAMAYMDDMVRENLSDGLLIKEFADTLFGKHTMLMAAYPHIYLDRVADYYERALILLPEKRDDISYSLATVYGELGCAEQAEKAWMRIEDRKVHKDWVHAELMYLLKRYDKAVPEMEECILHKAVELTVHLDLLRDTLNLSGNEELANEAGRLASQIRELFGLYEGFEDMSHITQFVAASDEEAVLENVVSLIMKRSGDTKLSTCRLFADIKPAAGEDTLDLMAAILEKL